MAAQDKASRKREFLEELAANGGHVSAARQKLRMAAATLARYRDDDPEFAVAWEETIERCVEDLESEVRRRALGYEEPIVYQGKIQGHWTDREGNICTAETPGAILVPTTIKKFSDTLLIFLLKGHRPEKYREGPGSKAAAANLSDAELDAAIARMLARKAKNNAPEPATDSIN